MKVRKDFGKNSERISFEFGPFKVDSRERSVRRSGKLLPLTPKAFDILLVLIQNPDRILEKGDIMKQVWPDTAVEESNLARNVSTLRKALDDDANNSKYIETVPWRGYRFIAGIRKLHEEADTIDSLAVLPFVNEGNGPNAEYLSDGITESLIHKLSLLHNLKVMSYQSIFKYKVRMQTEEFPEAKKVGLELGVGAVLTGHIRLVDDAVQVGVELVDTSDNHHLWGAQYNRTLSKIITLQETISRQIAEQLKLTLTGQDNQRLARPQTENPEAYELYLKGRYVLNRMTLENLHKGIELFKQAIEKDPDYALAYTGLLRPGKRRIKHWNWIRPWVKCTPHWDSLNSFMIGISPVLIRNLNRRLSCLPIAPVYTTGMQPIWALWAGTNKHFMRRCRRANSIRS